MTKSSPSRSARVARLARSDPAPGSLNSWHQACSPVSTARTYVRFSSSLPCAMMVGATSSDPRPAGGPGTPAAPNSAIATAARSAGRPWPYQAAGQAGAPQPESASSSSQERNDMPGSKWASIQARTCSRRRSGSSIGFTSVGTVRPVCGMHPDTIDIDVDSPGGGCMSASRDGTSGGPLDGVRVLDLSSVVMGPLATQILGDLGADVVTVENRDGDINRTMGPGPYPG